MGFKVIKYILNVKEIYFIFALNITIALDLGYSIYRNNQNSGNVKIATCTLQLFTTNE